MQTNVKGKVVDSRHVDLVVRHQPKRCRFATRGKIGAKQTAISARYARLDIDVALNVREGSPAEGLPGICVGTRTARPTLTKKLVVELTRHTVGGRKELVLPFVEGIVPGLEVLVAGDCCSCEPMEFVAKRVSQSRVQILELDGTLTIIEVPHVEKLQVNVDSIFTCHRANSKFLLHCRHLVDLQDSADTAVIDIDNADECVLIKNFDSQALWSGTRERTHRIASDALLAVAKMSTRVPETNFQCFLDKVCLTLFFDPNAPRASKSDCPSAKSIVAFTYAVWKHCPDLLDRFLRPLFLIYGEMFYDDADLRVHLEEWMKCIRSKPTRPKGTLSIGQLNLYPSLTELMELHRTVQPLSNRAYRNTNEYLISSFRVFQHCAVNEVRKCLGGGDGLNKINATRYDAVFQSSMLLAEFQQQNDLLPRHEIKLLFQPIDKQRNWRTTKKLGSQNVVCVSKDAFRTTIAWGYVADDTRRNEGVISIVFIDDVTNKEFESWVSGASQKKRVALALIDSEKAAFQYEPVLAALKGIEGSAVVTSIATLSPCRTVPGQLLQAVYGWDSPLPFDPRVSFDHNQRKAITEAFQHPVYCIQGPPGTGKSFVGSHICHMAVDMIKTKKKVRGKILVVSYKNHSLDEFLLDLVKRGVDMNRITRLGSRGSDEVEGMLLASKRASSRRGRSQVSREDVLNALRRYQAMRAHNKIDQPDPFVALQGAAVADVDSIFAPFRTNVMNRATKEKVVRFWASGARILANCELSRFLRLRPSAPLPPPVKGVTDDMSSDEDDNDDFYFTVVCHHQWTAEMKKISVAVPRSSPLSRANLIDGVSKCIGMPAGHLLALFFPQSDEKKRPKLLEDKDFAFLINAHVFVYDTDVSAVAKWVLMMLDPPLSCLAVPHPVPFDNFSTTEPRSNLACFGPNSDKCEQRIESNGSDQLVVWDHHGFPLCAPFMDIDDSYLRRQEEVAKYEDDESEAEDDDDDDDDSEPEPCVPLEPNSLWLLDGNARNLKIQEWWGNSHNSYSKEEMSDALDDYRELHRIKVDEERRLDLSILQDSDVVAGTITGCARHLQLLNELGPTVCIIEEAAEILDVQTLSCLSRRIQHVVMIGDHFQLQPQVDDYDVERNYNLKWSMFERLFRGGFPSTKLETQRRMAPAISGIVRPFYENDGNGFRIVDDSIVLCRKVPTLKFHDASIEVPPNITPPFVHQCMFWTHNSAEQKASVGASLMNATEIRMAETIIRLLLDYNINGNSITVLSYYRGQVRELQKKLKAYIDGDGVKVATVDSFQGDENDVIILSLVRGEKATEHLRKQNRMIVGISRARIAMFILGNDTLLRTQPHWNTVLNSRYMVARPQLEAKCPRHTEACVLIDSRKPDVPNSSDQRDDGRRQNYCNGTVLCKSRCLFEFPSCRHQCLLKCHPITAASHKECMTPLTRKLRCGIHEEAIRCHQRGSALSPCKTTVDYVRGCRTKHTIKLECWARMELEHTISNAVSKLPTPQSSVSHMLTRLVSGFYDLNSSSIDANSAAASKAALIASVEVEHLGKCCVIVKHVAIPCGHPRTLECHVDPSTIPCNERLPYRRRCGHDTSVSCPIHQALSQNCSEEDARLGHCVEKLRKQLPCGHFSTELECWIESITVTCATKVVLVRRCGHTIEVTCTVARRGDIGLPACSTLVQVVSSVCGHLVWIPCHQSASDSAIRNVVCTEPVARTLPCGHSAPVPCNQNDWSGHCCSAPVQRAMNCGHERTVACSELSLPEEKLPPCHEALNINLRCGHTSIQRCCDRNASIQCLHKCDRTLECGHRCRLSCWRPCRECVCAECIKKEIGILDEKRQKCSAEATSVIGTTTNKGNVADASPPKGFDCLDIDIIDDFRTSRQVLELKLSAAPEGLQPRKVWVAVDQSSHTLKVEPSNKMHVMYVKAPPLQPAEGQYAECELYVTDDRIFIVHEEIPNCDRLWVKLKAKYSCAFNKFLGRFGAYVVPADVIALGSHCVCLRRASMMLKRNSDAVEGSLPIPSYWGKECDGRRVNLPPTSVIFKQIETLCNANLGGTVLSRVSVNRIWVIANRKLFDHYMFKRQCLLNEQVTFSPVACLTAAQPLTKLHAPINSAINEFYLFHGTDKNGIDEISKHGFDARIACDDGLFGRGTYFADRFSKSFNYCKGSGLMLLSRVLVGDAYNASQTMRKLKKPPCNASGRPYNSVVGCGDSVNSEFIVYGESEALPEFFIEFATV